MKRRGEGMREERRSVEGLGDRRRERGAGVAGGEEVRGEGEGRDGGGDDAGRQGGSRRGRTRSPIYGRGEKIRVGRRRLGHS